MKSLEEQLSILRESCSKAGHFGFPKNAPTVEQTISLTKEFMTAHNIKESFEENKPRILRNNGSGRYSGEPRAKGLSKIEEKALGYMKRFGHSIREAFYTASNGELDLKDGKLPANVTAFIEAEWKAYNSRLSAADCAALAQRGCRP